MYLRLFSIWEKFLAGSEYIFVFLTIHILHHCRLKLLSLYSTKEIMQYLLDLKVSFPLLKQKMQKNNSSQESLFDCRSAIQMIVNISS